MSRFLQWQKQNSQVSIRDRVTLISLIIASVALGSIFCFFGFWWVAIIPVVAWVLPNLFAVFQDYRAYKEAASHIETIRCGYPGCMNPPVGGARFPGNPKIYHRCADHVGWFDDMAADAAQSQYRRQPWVTM